jgi:aminopeptidase N
MNNTTNSSRKTFPRIWLQQESTAIIPSLTKPKSSDEWVLFNIEAIGYYRVNYDAQNWKMLAAHLLNSQPENMLPASTRAQILDDALNLARAGILDYDLALNMTRYLATKQYHYVPWKTFFENLDRMLRDTTEHGWFQTYIIKTLTSVKNILGFNTAIRETQLHTLLRPGALAWLSKMGDPAVVGWEKDLFQQWTRSPTPDTENPIPLDVRSVVYCTAVMSGGRLEFEFVFE